MSSSLSQFLQRSQNAAVAFGGLGLKPAWGSSPFPHLHLARHHHQQQQQPPHFFFHARTAAFRPDPRMFFGATPRRGFATSSSSDGTTSSTTGVSSADQTTSISDSEEFSASEEEGFVEEEDPQSSDLELNDGEDPEMDLHQRLLDLEQRSEEIDEDELSESELEEDDVDLSLGPADVEVHILPPREMVEQLDRFIIGQHEAKKSLAVAMRNRWRRQRVGEDMKKYVTPRNVLMVGPTGVGKTEIARQLAKLLHCPFVRVEATKFTEVGYYGQDVDTIIRDLVQESLKMVKEFHRKRAETKIQRRVEQIILDALVGKSYGPSYRGRRKIYRQFLRDGLLENQEITIEVPPAPPSNTDSGFMMGGKVAFLMDFPGAGKKLETKRMTIAQARPILAQQAGEKLLNQADAEKHAIKFAEEHGIVFIDEIDKVVRNPNELKTSGDASAEGVQRDLLPLIEGCRVDIQLSGRHGPTHTVNTDHILFIASGAFHSVSVKDMLPELQGRLPVRVDMKPLTRHDLYRILTEPENSLIKQVIALFKTEGVDLQFTEDAIDYLAEIAQELNRHVENLGARRLHGIVEQVIYDLSYEAADMGAKEPGKVVVVDKDLIETRLAGMRKKSDLSQMVI